MCGIAGILSRKRELTECLPQMLQLLRHRGPDEGGIWRGTLVDKVDSHWHAAVGTQRLIVRGECSGRQPIVLPEGHVVVFNGEIYNYRKLMVDHGLYRTGETDGSDSRILAQALGSLGIDIIDELDGMFAIGHLDVIRAELTLAVDPFGQKPLYYTFLSCGGIAFASELKALLVVPEISSDLDSNALSQYFLLDHIPAPQTPFRRVQKLCAGSCIKWKPTILQAFRYFDVQRHVGSDQAVTTQDAIANVEKRLKAVVSLHLAEVYRPALALSGGIDSGLLASELAQQAGDSCVTYTVCYDDPQWDESTAAAQVASFLGVPHHRVLLENHEVVPLFERLTSDLDDPFADPACLPTLHLSRIVSSQTKVILTGDGGDELFGGYPRHKMTWLCSAGDAISHLLRPHRKRILKMLSGFHSTDGISSLYGKGLNLMYSDKDELYRQMSHVWRPSALSLLLTSRYREPLLTREVKHSTPPKTPWPSRAFCHDIAALAGILLPKTDRCTMSFGLEARAPFLDRYLAEYALALPHRLKTKGTPGKYVLRALLGQRIPHRLISSRKRGFGLPLSRWLRTCLRELASDCLLSNTFITGLEINRTRVEQLLKSHDQGTEDHATKIWSLLVLASWFRNIHSRLRNKTVWSNNPCVF